MQKNRSDPKGISQRSVELREELRFIAPEVLAERTGSKFFALGTGSGEFHLPLFGSSVLGTYPGFNFYTASGDVLSESQQLLLLYYFVTADGSGLSGTFGSYADLPGGRIYARAFQGYTGNEIIRAFGNDIESFGIACDRAGGIKVNVADAAYNFEVLPKLVLQFVYWCGDEEFPPSCKVLFDLASTHYLPIDVCAIVGSNITHRLIKNGENKET